MEGNMGESDAAMIIIPAAKRIRTGRDDIVTVEIPEMFRPAVWGLIHDAAIKSNDFLQVRFGLPHQPRTTGWRSQNHRFNGFCQVIAAETGNDFDTVKQCVKYRALSRGYPGNTDFDGRLIPQSEADASVEECTLLIEEVEQLGAELDIALPEHEEDDNEK